MAYKAIARSADGLRVAKIRYNREWNEYLVELWIEGTYIAEADYFAYDLDDAKGTAEEMVSG